MIFQSLFQNYMISPRGIYFDASTNEALFLCC